MLPIPLSDSKMNIIRLFPISILLLLAGCASTPNTGPSDTQSAGPSYDGSKIGIISVLDGPKHVHIGTTAFQNWTRPVNQEWNLTQHALGAMSKKLPNETFSIIESTAQVKDNNPEHWGMFSGKMSKSYYAGLATLAKQNDLKAILVLAPYSAKTLNTPVYSDGYGLISRCLIGFCSGYALDHVSLYYFDAENPTGKHMRQDINFSSSPLKFDLDKSNGIKNLASTEYRKAQQRYFDSLDQRLTRAVQYLGTR